MMADIALGLDLVVLAKPWRKGGDEGESKDEGSWVNVIGP